MKFIISILLLFLINAQNEKIEGEYCNHFGSHLKIYSNRTFLYKWNFDMTSSWSKGNWKMKNDTIYFEVIPVYDTLRISNLKDTLLLSMDEKPELITEKNGSITQFLSSGGQNRYKISTKLYFDGEKLIEIKKNGKLDRKERKAFWENKKYTTYYQKCNN